MIESAEAQNRSVELVASGSQLLRLNGGANPTYCAARPRSPNSTRYYCLVDTDGDNRLDQYFLSFSPNTLLPSLAHYPARRPLDTSVGYRAIDPMDFSDDIRLKLVVNRSEFSSRLSTRWATVGRPSRRASDADFEVILEFGEKKNVIESVPVSFDSLPPYLNFRNVRVFDIEFSEDRLVFRLEQAD